MTLTITPAINPVLRRRLLLLAGLIFALWASWQVSHDETALDTVSERTAPLQRRVVSKAPPVAPAYQLDWPARADQRQPVTDLFNLPQPPALAGPAAGSLAAPPVPLLKLKYVGRLDGSDNNHVFLADAQDRVISTKVGETVADGWQLLTMDSKQLIFRHTASGHEQTILTGAFQ